MLLDAAAGSPATVLRLAGDGRVERGSPVVMQCVHTTSAETRDSSSIVWSRRSGDVLHQLGVEDFLVAEFGAVGRVKITRETLPNSIVSNLTISGKLRSFTVNVSGITYWHILKLLNVTVCYVQGGRN